MIFGLTNDVIAVEFFRGERQGKEPIFSGEPSAGVFEFLDSLAVLPSKVYKYTCLIHFNDGAFIEKKFKFQRLGDAIDSSVKTDIAYLGGGIDTGNFSFRISNEIKEQGIEALVGKIQESSPQFLVGDNLETLRSRLSSLLWYSVERLDISSGNIWNFGISQEATFLDNAATRAEMGIPDLPRLGGCAYRVTPFMISPISILESNKSKVINPNNQEIEEISFRKFYSSLAQNWGAIPSGDRLARNSTIKERYILATKDERVLGGIAAQSFYCSMPELESNLQVQSTSFSRLPRRKNSKFNDIEVNIEFNRRASTLVLVSISGEDKTRRQKTITKLYFFEGRKGKIRINGPELRVSSITVESIE